MTPGQCRAARALLGWKQSDLSMAADLDSVTISAFETGATNQPHARTIQMIRQAFTRAGVMFISHKGVMLK